MKTFKEYLDKRFLTPNERGELESGISPFNNTPKDLHDIYSQRIRAISLLPKFDLNSYIISLRHDGLTPQMFCKDGFQMSVQASKSHYCEPRNDYGPYKTFEIGYPSGFEPLLKDYMENPHEDPKASIYPYTPKEVIEEVIKKHGGINWNRVLDNMKF